MSHTVETSRLSGDEKFRCDGGPVTDWEDPTVKGFWSWSTSDLNDNTTRGFLAEYYVALALDPRDPFRFRTKPWTSWDLETDEGVKIEVKATAVVQTWHTKSGQKTVQQWGIEPISVYDWVAGSYSDHKFRPSDVYVFCLHHHENLATLDATDLSQWEFYVLSTSVLDMERPTGKTIRLNPVKALGAKRVCHADLEDAILQAANIA